MIKTQIKIDKVEDIGDIGFDYLQLIDNRTGKSEIDIESKIFMLAEKINFILWYLKNKEK